MNQKKYSVVTVTTPIAELKIDWLDYNQDTSDEDVSISFSAPDGYSLNKDRFSLHKAAIKYQAAHGVDYIEAVRKLE